ncbi:MAG TPA: DoxX family protein [Cyclobacteriaceae bacterium]|nr:DoxX family protein [Cyclobacteriaceae bacterium]
MKRLIFSTRIYFVDVALLLLRVASALMIATHGWPKLSNFSEYLSRFADPLGLGPAVSLQATIFAEFFCALLVALGLLTRLALIPLIITMAVVAFIVHGQDAFGDKELALLYLFIFVSLFITGPGKYSLDTRFGRRGRY